MTVRFPTSGTLTGVALAFLLATLLLLPISSSAQVILGAGVASSGPGSGTVTSIATTSPITGGTITTSGAIACATCTTSVGMTTGLFPVASGAHALVNSVFGQDTSALVAAGSTAAVGGVGFNQAGNVEVIADGSTVVNAGMFAGSKNDFTIHDSLNENNNQFLIYNDSDGINNGIVLANYGTAPANGLSITFGDGAGGVTDSSHSDSFSSVLTQLAAANLSVGQSTVSGTNSMVFNVGTAFYGLALNNTFAVVRSAAAVQGDNLIFAQSDNQSSLIGLHSSDNLTGGIVQACSADSAFACGAGHVRGVVSLDGQDSTGTTSLSVRSPSTSGGGVVTLLAWGASAGQSTSLQFFSPAGTANIRFKAADDPGTHYNLGFVWPASAPTANGQPWVSTTAGGLSFAAGATIGAADVTVVGHYLSSTTAPAVSNTSANSCGTTAATIVGTDVAGKVTVGATAGTSCTVTFTTAFANAPACTVTNETTANLVRATSTTTTVILAGTMVAGDKLAYICMGRV